MRIHDDANRMLEHIRQALMIDPHWTIDISDKPDIDKVARIHINTRYKKGEIELNFQCITSSSELFVFIRHEVLHVLISSMDFVDLYVDNFVKGKTRSLFRDVSYDLNEHLLLHLEHLFDKNNLCCYSGYSQEEVTYANEEAREEGSGEEATQESSEEAS